MSITLKYFSACFAAFHVLDKDLQYSEQIYTLTFWGQCLESSCVRNHSECLAIVVYVSMCVLSVEMEAVVF